MNELWGGSGGAVFRCLMGALRLPEGLVSALMPVPVCVCPSAACSSVDVTPSSKGHRQGRLQSRFLRVHPGRTVFAWISRFQSQLRYPPGCWHHRLACRLCLASSLHPALPSCLGHRTTRQLSLWSRNTRAQCWVHVLAPPETEGVGQRGRRAGEDAWRSVLGLQVAGLGVLGAWLKQETLHRVWLSHPGEETELSSLES